MDGNSGGEVSAFAAYSGLTGNLSKKQRRRRNRNKKNSESFSDEPSKPTNIKRKNVDEDLESGIRNNKKLRLKKSTVVKEELDGPSNTLDKRRKKMDRKKKLNVPSTNNFAVQLTNGTSNKDVENTDCIAKRKVATQSVKIKQQKTLLTEKQVKQKIENNTKRIKKKMKLKKLDTEKKIRFSDSFEVIQSKEDDGNGFENQIEGPAAELVGEARVNQENRPTFISIINQIKKESADENSEPNKLVHEKLMSLKSKMLGNLKSSTIVGKELFETIIAPFTSDLFFKHHWEKKPLYVPGSSTKFKSLMSTQLIDDFLRNQVVLFGKHIDITSYKNGKRETHNPEGRALPHVVWDLYNHKCSVRLLSPQSALSNVFVMNTKLQEYFGCFVGANAYLTPPNSQGFAPHYDDIEAFVLQIEGQKRWKIYNPRNKYEMLPRHSSKNFTPTELSNPLMEVTLNPGDLLYFPRGFIHQADTSSSHSLHLTVSVYQKNSWTDLLEKMLPLALAKAAKEDLEFRKGLPLNYLREAGLVYKSVTMRKTLIKSIKQKMMRLLDYLDVDGAVDLMGVQYVSDSLPPVLTHEEASRCSLGNGLQMRSNGYVRGSIEFLGDTKVRFTTALCNRLVKEDVLNEDGAMEKQFKLYYSLDNSRQYHGEEPQYLVIPEDYVPAITALSLNYPDYTEVQLLPLPTLNEQANFVGDLWDRGILMTEKPLTEGEVNESEDEETNDKQNNKEDEEIENMDDEVANVEENHQDEEEDEEIEIIEDEKASDAENTQDTDEDEEEVEIPMENEENSFISLEEDTDNEKSFREYNKAIKENEKFVRGNKLDEDIFYLSSDPSNSSDVSE